MNPEAVFAAYLRGTYDAEVRTDAGTRYDLASLDRKHVIEFKTGLQSARDLYSAFLQLALYVQGDPNVEKAVLVAALPRMRATRVQDEWERAGDVLRPELRKRLRLVAWASDQWLRLPESDRELKPIEAAAREAFPERADRTDAPSRLSMWTPQRFEVWKILLDAWLQDAPPMPIQAIAARAGCSVPTVNDALSRLDSIGEIVRSRSRAAALRSAPRASLRELLGSAELLRRTRRFVDASGRGTAPNALLKRLGKLAPGGIAIGGVVAARAYHHEFNLNGLPRLDVTVLPTTGLAWVHALDPALKPAEKGSPAAVLVVHELARPELRSTRRHEAVPLADRAEVVLDLYDLGLTEQAEEFVRALREKSSSDV